MNKKLPYLLCLLVYLFSPMAFAQQPVEKWVSRYDSKGSQNDFSGYIAVDELGNSYITGTTNRTEAAYVISGSIVTVKYSPTGEELWAKVFRQDQSSRPAAIAVDNTGGVYVTGHTGYVSGEHDFVTVRYDAATGAESWVQQYNGPANGSDEATGIVVDNKGGVYVTGASSNFPGGIVINDIATIRYDAATGQESWVQRFKEPTHERAAPAAITIDKTGNLYVTGYSSDTNENTSYATVSYEASTGTQRWVSYYTSGKNTYARAIAVDNQGGVYVTGYSYSSSNTSSYVTIRYDAATGSQTWLMRFAGEQNSNNIVQSIAVDSQGGVFVAGTASRTGNSFVSDYATIRYEAATGNETWVQRYNGGANGAASAIAVAVDKTGGVFITGGSRFPDTGNDFVTVRYKASTGQQSWTQRYNGPATSHDQASAIAVSKTGSVIVTGYSEGNEKNYDFATISYDAITGTQNWASQHDVISSIADYAIAIAVDAEGNSYVTGTSAYEYDLELSRSSIVTIKYSPSGEELWVQTYKSGQSNAARAIAVDNRGGVYITGFTESQDTGSDYITVRYDAATGQESWVQRFNGESNHYDFPADIAVDEQGGVYVTGSSWSIVSPKFGFRTYATIRYDAATGEATWTSIYEGARGNNLPRAMAVDNAGGVYVTGVSATVRYDAASGAQTWEQTHDNNNFISATAIAVDYLGGVYVTGSHSTVRFDAATGQINWYQPLGFGNAVAIAADNTGGVFVTGTSSSSSSSGFISSFATIRYEATTGAIVWEQHFNRENNKDDRARAIALDNKGGVYVTGLSWSENTDIILFSTVKYNALNGAHIWDIQNQGPFDIAVDMALDSYGNVIVTGQSLHIASDYDFLTIMYSQDQCPVSANATMTGSTNEAAGKKASAYSLPVTGATNFTWHITGSDGQAHTSFTGQGSSSILVDWPSTPDIYKVLVTYGGQSGCAAQETTMFVHVFDPEDGFVTGGGWMYLPTSPDHELMRNSGRAHWAFAAKYKKETEDMAQGSLLLLLKDGSSIFRSTNVEDGSLVITGNTAYFRGKGRLTYLDSSGKIATSPSSFGYLVSATDGDYSTNKGKKGRETDQLRILIWKIEADGSQGAIVFDNQASCSSSEPEYNEKPCQNIGGGNIAIHVPNLKNNKNNTLFAMEGVPATQPLQAYPTAFTDRTTLGFAFEQGTDYSLELYDLKGTLLRQVAAGTAEPNQLYEHEMRAESLTKGLYLVRLTNGEKVQTVKVIVQK